MNICSACGTKDSKIWAHPRTTVVGKAQNARIEKANSTLCEICHKEHKRIKLNFHNRKNTGKILNTKVSIKESECGECGQLTTEFSATTLIEVSGTVQIGGTPRTVCGACNNKLKGKRKQQERNRKRIKKKIDDPEGYRFMRLREKYEITKEDFHRIKDQRTCEICGGDNGGRTLMLDHCHATGQIRGMLCRGCNHALGHFKDSIELMNAADLYLEAYEFKFGR